MHYAQSLRSFVLFSWIYICGVCRVFLCVYRRLHLENSQCHLELGYCFAPFTDYSKRGETSSLSWFSLSLSVVFLSLSLSFIRKTTRKLLDQAEPACASSYGSICQYIPPPEVKACTPNSHRMSLECFTRAEILCQGVKGTAKKPQFGHVVHIVQYTHTRNTFTNDYSQWNDI